MTLDELIAELQDLKKTCNGYGDWNPAVRLIDEKGNHFNLKSESLGLKNPFAVIHIESSKQTRCEHCGDPRDYCDCGK